MDSTETSDGNIASKLETRDKMDDTLDDTFEIFEMREPRVIFTRSMAQGMADD